MLGHALRGGAVDHVSCGFGKGTRRSKNPVLTSLGVLELSGSSPRGQTARPHRVQVAIDIEFQQIAGRIAGMARRLCLGPRETGRLQIKPVDQRVDKAHRIVDGHQFTIFVTCGTVMDHRGFIRVGLRGALGDGFVKGDLRRLEGGTRALGDVGARQRDNHAPARGRKGGDGHARFVAQKIYDQAWAIGTPSQKGEDVMRDHQPKDQSSSVTDIDWGGIADSLAKGLAGKLGAFLGAELLGAIFPSSSSIDWAKLAAVMQQLIQAELDAHTIETTQDELDGVINFLNTEYLNLKKADPTDRQLLSSKIQPYDHDMYAHVITIFEDPQLAQQALANFMVAAGTHLAILQEEALVDPDQSDPTKSGYAKTVSVLADSTLPKSYSTFATNTAKQVIATRMAQISAIQSYCSEGQWQGECLGERWYFNDQGQRYGDFSSESGANSSYNQHVADVRTSITNQMQTNVYDVVKTWTLLVDNPIPISTRKGG